MHDDGGKAVGLPDAYAGYLEKKGKLRNGTWKRRYFALRGHHLLCFADAEPARPVLASIDVVKVEISGPEAQDEASIFNLKVLEGSIKLRAPSIAEREIWTERLELAQHESLTATRERRSAEHREQIMKSYTHRHQDDVTSTLDAALAEETKSTSSSSSSKVMPSRPPESSKVTPSRPREEPKVTTAREPEEPPPQPRELTGKYRVNMAGNDVLNMLAGAGYASAVSAATPACKARPPLERSNTTACKARPPLERSGSGNLGSFSDPPRRPRRRSYAGPSDLANLASWDWDDAEAERWICEVLGMAERPPGTSDMWHWLRDGKVLCDLANALRPSSIRKVHDSRLGFKQLENISHFLAACRDVFGLEERSLFESLDLYDRKGTQQVLNCLSALRKASVGANTAPTPPVSHAEPEVHPSSADSGSETPSKKKAPTVPTMFQRRPSAVDVDPNYVPTHQTAAASQTQKGANSITSDGYATVITEHEASDKDELTVFIGDVVNVKLERGGWHFAEENEGWVLVQKGGEQGLVPASCLKAGTSETSYFKAGGGRGSSALDKELAAKAAAKYDPIAEALAQHWIEQVTGHVFRKPFADELKDGVLLCKLVNELAPGSVPKIYEGSKAFGQMDNISAFLKAVKKLGVLSRDTFETTDLFELRDLNLVVQCLFALSKALVKSVPGWTGPYLTGHDAGFNEAVMSNLKVIIGVAEYRDRNRHYQQQQQQIEEQGDKDEDEDVISEAVEYRLAMLGLRDSQVAGANVHGVDRTKLEPSFLVVWSSSTKSTLAMETDERRLIALLAAKRKRYEMVYVDVSPERKVELNLICQGQDVPLPALTFGAHYHGTFETLQELEDDGKFDDLIAEAQQGEGFWALPEAWSTRTSMLEGGGMQIVNQVPAL